MSTEIVDRLLAAGLSPHQAQRKEEIFNLTHGRLRNWAGGERPDWIRCFVPGRIEVLGKHTDYAGGRSLLCAVERGICAVAAPRPDATVRIADALRKQECEFSISAALDARSEHWPLYPRTVARRLASNFPGPLRGLDLVFASDLPRASGMSSSSALLTCTYLLLKGCNDLAARPEFAANIRSTEQEAAYLACIENGQTFGTLTGDAGVGTQGGSEDHTAIFCSRPGSLRQYAFCPARFEAEVPLPRGFSFLIANCGVAADKTGAARERYNQASAAAREILRLWQEASGRAGLSLAQAAARQPEAPTRIRDLLARAANSSFSAQALRDRFDQFFEETMQIIPGAVAALRANDLDAFGNWVDRSQFLAEEKLGNQIPQTIALARSARRLGASAASAFGAGFGGSVWALSPAGRAAEFLRLWEESYRQQFPGEAQMSAFFMSAPGPAALVF